MGLSRLAQEWGRTQWVAFGCSFFLTNGLAVVLPRTNGDLALVGIVGGAYVAALVVISAFRPAPIWADWMAGHPPHNLDDALLTPLRFSVMAALRSDVEIDFSSLRDLLETDDSALSKAISTLGSAGYVAVRKGYVGNRPRTWLTATPAGSTAMGIHVAALQAIAAGLPPPT